MAVGDKVELCLAAHCQHTQNSQASNLSVSYWHIFPLQGWFSGVRLDFMKSFGETGKNGNYGSGHAKIPC